MTKNQTGVRGVDVGHQNSTHGAQSEVRGGESKPLGTSSPHLTTDVLSRLKEHKRSQLDEWLKDPQSHEQLALGQKTARASQQITTFFNDIETKVEGDGK